MSKVETCLLYLNRLYLPDDGDNNLFTLVDVLHGDAISSDKKSACGFIEGTSDVNRGTSEANRGTFDVNRGTSEADISKKRLSKQLMDELVSSICQDWMDKEEIAQKVNRTVKYVADVVLPRMLREKILEMLYPGRPNHPRQKYKIKI